MIQLPPRLRRQLEQSALEGYPNEACGLLIGRRSPAGAEVSELAETSNVSSDPRRGYEIDPVAYIGADDLARARGREIIGIWHSHPDHSALPSARDRAQAWVGWSYLIIALDAEGARGLSSWRLGPQGFTEEPISEFEGPTQPRQ